VTARCSLNLNIYPGEKKESHALVHSAKKIYQKIGKHFKIYNFGRLILLEFKFNKKLYFLT